MPVADPNMIPLYDMLGLPAPPWLMQFLMALTLALHWAFLATTVGGAVAYLLARRADPDAPSPLMKSLSAFLPFGLTTAMTLGIAPLLFVQVLYGQFFYTANILTGYVWLGLLALMIANFYLLYYGWRRQQHGKAARCVGAMVLVLMGVMAMILASNATLTHNPGAWESMRGTIGTALYLGDATFWPRWAMAISTLIAGGGLFVASYARLGPPRNDPLASANTTMGLYVCVAGMIGTLACGLWAAVSLPEHIRSALMGDVESVLAYIAAGAFAGCLVLAAMAIRSPGPRNLLAACLLLFVGLFAAAGLRDTLRRLALAEHFSLASVTQHPQWGSFLLFAVVFVLGLALIAYMVRMAFGGTDQLQSRS